MMFGAKGPTILAALFCLELFLVHRRYIAVKKLPQLKKPLGGAFK